LDEPEDLRSTRQGVLESYSAMKVARWVREGAVGKGLSSGNHLAFQAGRNSISTSLAAYFMRVLGPHNTNEGAALEGGQEPTQSGVGRVGMRELPIGKYVRCVTLKLS